MHSLATNMGNCFKILKKKMFCLLQVNDLIDILQVLKFYIHCLYLMYNSILLSDKYASQFGAGSSYAYFHDEDESTFHLVDTTRVQKPPYQRGRARGQRGRGARGARTPGGMTTLNKV